MGMSIDNCIDELEWIKSTGIYPYGNTQDKLHTDDYIDVVIDILHKYQKIAQILKDIPYGGEATVRRIQEVIEDGNDDCN